MTNEQAEQVALLAAKMESTTWSLSDEARDVIASALEAVADTLAGTHALQAECKTLRALLRELEWCRDDVEGECCRMCSGTKLQQWVEGGVSRSSGTGHFDDCRLAAALGVT